MSSTPFFPLYVADYQADTAHLTTEQHGAYLLLLMAAWSRGGRLPADEKKLARIARVSARRWHLIADDVLEFFELEDGEVVSKRLEREHQKAVSKSAKRSAAGKRGVAAKALKNNKTAQAIARANAQANLKHSPEPEPYRDTNVSLVDSAVEAYRSICVPAGLPDIRGMTDKRRSALLARLQAEGSDAWVEVCRKAASAPHLTGQNDRSWKANFDWLTNPNNFLKVIEGNYDRSDDDKPRPPTNARQAATDARRAALLSAANAAAGSSDRGGEGPVDIAGGGGSEGGHNLLAFPRAAP